MANVERVSYLPNDVASPHVYNNWVEEQRSNLGKPYNPADNPWIKGLLGDQTAYNDYLHESNPTAAVMPKKNHLAESSIDNGGTSTTTKPKGNGYVPMSDLIRDAQDVNDYDKSQMKDDKYYYDAVEKLLGHSVNGLSPDLVREIYEKRSGDQSPYLGTGSNNPYYTPLMAEIDNANANPPMDFKDYSEGESHDNSAYWDANRNEMHNVQRTVPTMDNPGDVLTSGFNALFNYDGTPTANTQVTTTPARVPDAAVYGRQRGEDMAAQLAQMQGELDRQGPRNQPWSEDNTPPVDPTAPPKTGDNQGFLDQLAGMLAEDLDRRGNQQSSTRQPLEYSDAFLRQQDMNDAWSPYWTNGERRAEANPLDEIAQLESQARLPNNGYVPVSTMPEATGGNRNPLAESAVQGRTYTDPNAGRPMYENSYSRALADNQATPDTNIFRQDIQPSEEEVNDAYNAYIGVQNSQNSVPTRIGRNGRTYTGVTNKAQNPEVALEREFELAKQKYLSYGRNEEDASRLAYEEVYGTTYYPYYSYRSNR